MKLKRLLSTALAMVMALSLSVPAFAANPSHQTEVTYEGKGTENYLLTVPATLKPGTGGDVILKGTWPSTRTISVTAEETVKMTGSIGGSKTLDVTFAGINQPGSNEVEVTKTERVSVSDMTALFGEWMGTFKYNVSTSGNGATTPDKDNINWAQKVKMRNISNAEYDKLCDAANESNDLMHWDKMYSWTDDAWSGKAWLRTVRGFVSARDSGNCDTASYTSGGARPAFEILNSDDRAGLSVGDVVTIGTLYVGNDPIKVPTNPVYSDDNVHRYGVGNSQKITLGKALDDAAYQMKAIYVGDGVFVCDRVMLINITWNQLNTALS